MADDKKKTQYEMMFSENSLKIEFADMIQFNASADILVLDFLQRSGKYKITSAGNSPARIAGRFAITWDHAKRMHEVLTKFIESNENGELDELKETEAKTDE